MVHLRSLALALLLAALPFSGDAQDESPQNAEAPTLEGQLTSEDVKESQMPPPTDQGTRPPGVLDEDEDDQQTEQPEPVEPEGLELTPQDPDEQAELSEGPDLYQLLTAVRRSPPPLEGERLMRPNNLASEPAKEMAPAQPREAYLFPEDYIE